MERFIIPPPEAILGGYTLGKHTDTHERVAKIFVDNPNKDWRMIEVAKRFPDLNAETIRTHIRKLHSQGFLYQPMELRYRLNPAYTTPQQKHAEVIKHLDSGQSRLRVVEAPKEQGPYARVSGTMGEVLEEMDRRIEKSVAEAPKTAVVTISSAGELLKRHLSSLRERMEANSSFTKADIEMLEELEVMAGL